MKLLKIDTDLYVDPESIVAIRKGYLATEIYFSGSSKPVEAYLSFERMVAILQTAEEIYEND